MHHDLSVNKFKFLFKLMLSFHFPEQKLSAFSRFFSNHEDFSAYKSIHIIQCLQTKSLSWVKTCAWHHTDYLYSLLMTPLRSTACSTYVAFSLYLLHCHYTWWNKGWFWKKEIKGGFERAYIVKLYMLNNMQVCFK